MRIGIVGSEAAKFTQETEREARQLIEHILVNTPSPDIVVVSGGCHLGGIDIWAEEVADALFASKIIHKPRTLSWPSYKARNLAIVRDSDEVHCITIKSLPEGYTGMRFPLCYHCKTDLHVKSGGCWTMHQARKAGKPGILHVI